jgi:hypothetical protein
MIYDQRQGSPQNTFVRESQNSGVCIIRLLTSGSRVRVLPEEPNLVSSRVAAHLVIFPLT